jgi:hypothetical protein
LVEVVGVVRVRLGFGHWGGMGAELCEMLGWGVLADIPVLVGFIAVTVLLAFEEELLSVGSNLGAVATSYECFNFFPVFSIELQS